MLYARMPEPIKALEELRASAEKTVYVGDSDVDFQKAKNAGLVCVGVTWGFRDRNVLVEEGADCIIESPEELLDILEKMPVHNGMLNAINSKTNNQNNMLTNSYN